MFHKSVAESKENWESIEPKMKPIVLSSEIVSYVSVYIFYESLENYARSMKDYICKLNVDEFRVHDSRVLREFE